MRLAVDANGDVRIDVLEWLRTRASFRDVADALEAADVAASWRAARRRNLHEKGERDRLARERDR